MTSTDSLQWRSYPMNPWGVWYLLLHIVVVWNKEKWCLHSYFAYFDDLGGDDLEVRSEITTAGGDNVKPRTVGIVVTYSDANSRNTLSVHEVDAFLPPRHIAIQYTTQVRAET